MSDEPKDKRWVCGKKYDGTFVVVELRGRITGCYFFIDTIWDGGKSHREAGQFIGYSNRPKNSSSALHHRREGAIESMTTKLLAEQVKCRQRADEISAELEKVAALI